MAEYSDIPLHGGRVMTTAPPLLLEARSLLLRHLDMHPGVTVPADLDPAEVGITAGV